MTTKEEIAGFSDPELIHAHARSHYVEKSLEAMTDHHLFCAEMTKRGIDHGHEAESEWAQPVEVSKTENQPLEELVKKELPTELVAMLREAMDQGYAFADVIGLITLSGYAFTLVPIGAPEVEDEVTDETNCPECAGGCNCAGSCSCWSGCTCTDCADAAEDPMEKKAPIVDRFVAAINKALFGEVDHSLLLKKPSPSVTKAIVSNQEEVAKAVAEDMFTLAPMYVPNFEDAHGEWTDARELQKAVWEYVKTQSRDIRLQHNLKVVAGEWVEIMAIPFATEVPMVGADGTTVMKSYPANTVFMGVQWKPWAWELVKSGKIRGYSIGGLAARIQEDIPKEKAA